jgi:hypothetical protein
MSEQMKQVLEMISWPMVVRIPEGLDGSFLARRRAGG